ncbi:MAG: PQQ-dependent dehydrogenase, methanol/ethanol family [Novosphingobium sp.]|nr:PQQ-dependent dehydrogenase, methanol/ethanol family [Novosphingobium sp.]
MKGVSGKVPGLVGVAVLALALAGCSRIPGGGAEPADLDWAKIAGDDAETGFSAASQLTPDNAGRIGLAWYMDLDEGALEATPLAVDGTLYFTGARSNVYAVDAVTGKLKWDYDPEIGKHNPDKLKYSLPVNRGAAYDNGKVFAGTLDGRLIALDAKTGKLIWSADTVPADSMHTVTGAPRVFRGKVIIGNAGADWTMRGYVTAYDQESGKKVWRFYTAPGKPDDNAGDPAMERAASTWSGEWWKTGTGGTVWNGMTFDPEFNRIYIGTGNGGPYDPAFRNPQHLDNLYLASIVALDADTGKYVWHYQVNPAEAWDYKATANMIAATIAIDGKPRKVLMQAPTNGFFYVLDRESGKPISAAKLGKVTWAKGIDLKSGRPIEYPDIRYEKGHSDLWPGPLGAHNWQPMTYSPKTGLVYIPYMQMGMRYSTEGQGEGQGGEGANSYGSLTLTPLIVDKEDGKGALIAWDPVAQKARWKVQHDTMWNGGTLVTAGGLVFQGLQDGRFLAYDAANGKQLWSFDAHMGIIAAPSTYKVDGKQYVSVLAGTGSVLASWSKALKSGWKYRVHTTRLLTFALDGKADLPPSPPRDFSVSPVDDPAFVVDEAAAKRGRAVAGMYCTTCHGVGLDPAGNMSPDLRESGVVLDRDAFRLVAGKGQLAFRGMPRFAELSDADLEDLRAYIRQEARAAMAANKAREKSGGH